MSLKQLQSEIRKQTDLPKAAFLQRFFKTGKGEYSEGDVFLGLTVPQSRVLANKYLDLSIVEIKTLLKSKYHEERLIALLILVHNFKIGGEKEKEKIFKFYLASTKYINNWDLVDLSADKIVGEYLRTRNSIVLDKLAKSRDLWEKRIAIVATYQFIKNNQFNKTLEIAKILMKDRHDLIHKAVGWMLREVGKRDEKALVKFLDQYVTVLPRTTLRYAIERFPEKKRLYYLKK